MKGVWKFEHACGNTELIGIHQRRTFGMHVCKEMKGEVTDIQGFLTGGLGVICSYEYEVGNYFGFLVSRCLRELLLCRSWEMYKKYVPLLIVQCAFPEEMFSCFILSFTWTSGD